MKREFAATIFSASLAGTAIAGPIEQTTLPPPPAEQNASKTSAEALQFDEWQPSAELWLEGVPESDGISLDALANKAKRDANGRVIEQDTSLPTKYGWNRGNWKANVGANVTTASATPTVIPTDLYATSLSPSGGTGAIDGRLEYDLSSWQFYGGTRRALVANPDGTLAMNNNFIGGTYYNLPPALLGGKLGTGFDVNPSGDAKTRLEYRQDFGSAEGFLSAERTTPFQHTGPDVIGVHGLKAGINRKF